MANQIPRLNRLSSLAYLMVSASFCLPVVAQEAFLEEVLVTAQKREQSAQDVGVAIAAFSGATLREQNIDSVNDLERIVSNFSVIEIAGLTVPIIRGVGLQNFRVNDSPTASYYIDDVYQTSVAATALSMYDLERVEVLKGPQGGLYGRNSIAGAIQVISNKPQVGEVANANVMLGYGSFANTLIDFGAGMPISDKVAMRIAGRWEKSDEGPSKGTQSNSDYGSTDRWASRLQLRYQPTDNLDLLFKVHGGQDNSELQLLRAVGQYTDIGTADVIGAPTLSAGLAFGIIAPGTPGTGLCASILEGKGSDPRTCATVIGLTPEKLGLGSSGDDRYDAVDPSLFPRLDNEWAGASAIATFAMGDYTLTSVSSFDSLDYGRATDFDATYVASQDTDYESQIDFWAQEFRLAFEGEGSFTWLLGLNYAEDKLEEDSVLYGAGGALPLFFSGATSSSQQYEQKTKALAVFGHGEWQPSESWRVIGEMRYTDVDKSFAGEQFLLAPGQPVTVFFTVDDSADFQNVSGKISLEFNPLDDVLLYGSISNGFKAGGFFGGFVTTPDDFEAYDEETILAYETGIKSDWFEHRLRANASIFYYDRQDVQSSASNPTEGTRVARLTNIGDVESKGAELDLSWLPTSSLFFNLSLGYTDSEIVDSDFISVSAVTFLPAASLEGINVPNYSKVSANLTGRYEHAIGDTLLGSVQLEYSYRSERDLTLILHPEIEEPLFLEPSYNLVNLRLGLSDLDKQWQLMAFVENLTDEEYRVEASSDGFFGLLELYGQPLTWGLRLNYSWN